MSIFNKLLAFDTINNAEDSLVECESPLLL